MILILEIFLSSNKMLRIVKDLEADFELYYSPDTKFWYLKFVDNEICINIGCKEEDHTEVYKRINILNNYTSYTFKLNCTSQNDVNRVKQTRQIIIGSTRFVQSSYHLKKYIYCSTVQLLFPGGLNDIDASTLASKFGAVGCCTANGEFLSSETLKFKALVL